MEAVCGKRKREEEAPPETPKSPRLDYGEGIGVLPPEVILTIFEQFDPTRLGEFARCALVCRQWRDLATGPQLWRSRLVSIHKCADSERQLASRGYPTDSEESTDPWAVIRAINICHNCRRRRGVYPFNFKHEEGLLPVLLCSMSCQQEETGKEGCLYRTAAEKEYGLARDHFARLPRREQHGGGASLYMRRDVQDMALVVHGSQEGIDLHIMAREERSKKRKQSIEKMRERRLVALTDFLGQKGISLDDVPAAAECYRLWGFPTLPSIEKGAREIEFLTNLAKDEGDDLERELLFLGPRRGVGSFRPGMFARTKRYHAAVDMFGSNFWRQRIIQTWVKRNYSAKVRADDALRHFPPGLAIIAKTHWLTIQMDRELMDVFRRGLMDD